MSGPTPRQLRIIKAVLGARDFPKRNRTKKGPGRIPFFKTGKPAGSKIASKKFTRDA